MTMVATCDSGIFRRSQELLASQRKEKEVEGREMIPMKRREEYKMCFFGGVLILLIRHRVGWRWMRMSSEGGRQVGRQWFDIL